MNKKRDPEKVVREIRRKIFPGLDAHRTRI